MSDDTDNSPEQFIEFKCPACGGEVSFPAGDAGAVQACPFCAGIFVVPDQNGAPGQPWPIPIATPRLMLRRLRIQDVGDLTEFMGQEQFVRHTESTPMDEEGIADWLGRDQSNSILQPGQCLWLGMEFKEDGKIIGLASVTYYRESLGAQPDRQAIISVSISPAYQRKGLGLEVVQNLLAFGFKGLKLRRITANCDARNAAAKALLTKAGLRFEGEFFQESFVKGQWVDTDYFAMLAAEYDGGDRGEARQPQVPAPGA